MSSYDPIIDGWWWKWERWTCLSFWSCNWLLASLQVLASADQEWGTRRRSKSTWMSMELADVATRANLSTYWKAPSTTASVWERVQSSRDVLRTIITTTRRSANCSSVLRRTSRYPRIATTTLWVLLLLLDMFHQRCVGVHGYVYGNNSTAFQTGKDNNCHK